MFKKKTEKKSEEKVKPSNQEVKALLDKAKKVAEKKEKASLAKKLDLMLKKVGKIDTIEKTLKEIKARTDKLEAVYNKPVIGATNPKDKSTKKKPTNEELLAQVQAEQEKAQGKKEQPAQQPGQTQEQTVLGATQQFREDIGTAQAAQEQAQQKGQQPQPGQVLTPQGAWLLERASHAAEIILPAFFQSKGSSGNPLKGFFDELKIYQGIEHTVLDGFFNYMKMLPGSQRQETMRSIQSSPPTPTMTNLPPKSEMIE